MMINIHKIDGFQLSTIGILKQFEISGVSKEVNISKRYPLLLEIEILGA